LGQSAIGQEETFVKHENPAEAGKVESLRTGWAFFTALLLMAETRIHFRLFENSQAIATPRPNKGKMLGSGMVVIGSVSGVACPKEADISSEIALIALMP